MATISDIGIDMLIYAGNELEEDTRIRRAKGEGRLDGKLGVYPMETFEQAAKSMLRLEEQLLAAERRAAMAHSLNTAQKVTVNSKNLPSMSDVMAATPYLLQDAISLKPTGRSSPSCTGVKRNLLLLL